MKKTIVPIFLLMTANLALAQEKNQEKDKEIEEVVIFATPTQPTKRVGDALSTGTEITQKGIEALGVVANGSIFNLVNIVPSVITQSSDAYGLGQNVMRVRGVRNLFAGITIEGVPNYGVSPIGPREDVFDKENLGSVSFYKGAIPADVFSASGNRGGSADVSFRRSSKNTGLEFLQSIGSNSFTRSFVRFNTGEHTSGNSKTSAFGSFLNAANIQRKRSLPISCLFHFYLQF